MDVEALHEMGTISIDRNEQEEIIIQQQVIERRKTREKIEIVSCAFHIKKIALLIFFIFKVE